MYSSEYFFGTNCKIFLSKSLRNILVSDVWQNSTQCIFFECFKQRVPEMFNSRKSPKPFDKDIEIF